MVAPGSRRGERGFTIAELLVALTVLLIGVSGVLALQLTAFRATAYTRHATEAAALGEDRMEHLRTVPLGQLSDGEERVDASGRVDADGPFTRSWTIAAGDGGAIITVTVRWDERGDEQHALVFTTERRR